MIQVLTHSGKDAEYQSIDIKINSFHDAESLDCYDINVILLNDGKIWENRHDNKSHINSEDDLGSLHQMLKNCHKSKNVIVFPQNRKYFYDYGVVDYRYDREGYLKSSELKNMIPEMIGNILRILYDPIKSLDLIYENTKTQVGNKQIAASFYFNKVSQELCLTKSTGSEKVTTISLSNIVLSTLELKDAEEVLCFLKSIHVLSDVIQDCPEWVEGLQMFDDLKQIDIIRENQEKIQIAESNIDQAKRTLSENNRYKSILYTYGEKLVEVVFEILEKMLGVDLSKFEDRKKEDFLIQLGDDIFIGEIKGVNHNVKSENVSQLDVHYQGYLEDHPEIHPENIHALLIMDHQKNKELKDREPVHEQQIKLAERNGSLIIETFTLLKIFEKYLNKNLTREQCINLLSENTGLLKI